MGCVRGMREVSVVVSAVVSVVLWERGRVGGLRCERASRGERRRHRIKQILHFLVSLKNSDDNRSNDKNDGGTQTIEKEV